MKIDKLVRSKRKTIGLIVQRDGSLVVRAPLRASRIQIEQVVQEHQEWIRCKQAEILTRPALPAPKVFTDGESFQYLGRRYPLAIVAGARSRLQLLDGRFLLTRAALPDAREAFLAWYKAQARSVLSERVAQLAKRYGFSYRQVKINSARTRWGSCTSKNNLNFTWRLVLAPSDVIDYVVIHELVHTVVKNHSPHYWERVKQIMPDYRRHVKWLKEHGPELTIE